MKKILSIFIALYMAASCHAQKISDMTEATSTSSNSFIPILDNATSANRKIKVSNLFGANALIRGTNTYTANTTINATGTFSLTTTGLTTIGSPSVSISGTSVRFPNAGTAGANKILTSDANGYATWQTNSASSLKLFQVLANGNTGGANNILMNDNQYIGAVTDGDQYTWAYFYDDVMLIAAQDISTNAFADFSANISDQANPHAYLEINSSAGNSSTYDVTKDFHQVSGSIGTFEGIRYDIDYSANYTSRSLIDKGFADGRYPIQQDKKVATTFTCTTGGGGILENITGLSANIVSGHNYHFRACLFFTANIGTNDGSKVAIGGTATASDVSYTVNLFASGAGSFIGSSLQTALGSGVGQVSYTDGQYIIEGTIFCNGTGTLTVQGTENTDVSSPPTFRKGSTFTVTEIQ